MIFNKDLWSDSIESPSWPSSQKTRFLANVAHILLLDGFLRFLVGSYIVLFCEIAVLYKPTEIIVPKTSKCMSCLHMIIYYTPLYR